MTKDQRYRSNEPNSRCTSRKACALVTVESILRRLRTMPESSSSFAFRAASKRATFFGSNWAKELGRIQKWLQREERARVSATA